MIQTERRKAGSANPRRCREEAERVDNVEEERVRTPNNPVLGTRYNGSQGRSFNGGSDIAQPRADPTLQTLTHDSMRTAPLLL
ncbi:hypothetical protein Pyn_17026 [Prunus yedoensis var. nudiflora]|uniref:Uncharacterized protein n=1 Tax=Prunus yedoensis var. nudiflora TaxID=2094558 RepID=A0A314ZBT5_PRUYE|nr:hypothetical protein Pyn_17026 [Prunus yedoensis var. nudiflora]